jgi:pimeloyl-ACP methyl ester carboxylesterase
MKDMIAKSKVKTGTLRVNGADIYHEIRGTGPSILFIQGATGDGGTFENVAELLSDQFTVVTYDRRGNSRSPAPSGWQTTSMQEQADDAAELIKALGISPSAVFGTSGGALILLQLVASHPEVLRGAIVHEPAMLANMPGADEMVKGIRAFMEENMSKGGPRYVLEHFLPQVAGENAFKNLEPELRERMLGNANVLVTIEMMAFASYAVDLNRLRKVGVPLIIAAGRDNAGTNNPMLRGGYEAARWLASQLGSKLHELSGAHAPYLDRPDRLAEELTPLIPK